MDQWFFGPLNLNIYFPNSISSNEELELERFSGVKINMVGTGMQHLSYNVKIHDNGVEQ